MHSPWVDLTLTLDTCASTKKCCMKRDNNQTIQQMQIQDLNGIQIISSRGNFPWKGSCTLQHRRTHPGSPWCLPLPNGPRNISSSTMKLWPSSSNHSHLILCDTQQFYITHLVILMVDGAASGVTEHIDLGGTRATFSPLMLPCWLVAWLAGRVSPTSVTRSLHRALRDGIHH